MRKFSISDKLILASLLISIVTIFIVASYSFYNAKDAILQRAFNQLTSVRIVKSNLVEQFISNCMDEVELACTSSDIKELTTRINQFEDQIEPLLIDDFRRNGCSSFIEKISRSYYKRIIIVGSNNLNLSVHDRYGEQVHDQYDYNSLASLISKQEKVIVEDLLLHDGASQPFIRIISEITNKDEQVFGFLVFELSTDPLDRIMLEESPSNGLGISGESYLVGDDYLMRSSSRFQKNSVLRTTVKTDAVYQAFEGKTGEEIITDYRNISVLSSFSKMSVSNLNWVILAEIDYDEVTVPIYRIMNEIIFISIFIFFIVLTIVYILSRKITYPIQKLSYAAGIIGNGNLDVVVPNSSNDEIGDLTNVFNTMVKRLKQQSVELKVEREKSLRSLIDGQETERQRISRELHDSLGQFLIGLKLNYESCLNKLNSGKFRFEDFKQLGFLFDQTIQETRRISNNLMPVALTEFGLNTAIRNLCNEIADNAHIEVKFEATGNCNNLSSTVRTYVYRIIQESLTNTLKHANATQMDIVLEQGSEFVKLKIVDNGIGFNACKIWPSNSNGIRNIKDRVALLKGEFEIMSNVGEGTQLNILIPIEKTKDE